MAAKPVGQTRFWRRLHGIKAESKGQHIDTPQNLWKSRKTEWGDFLADYFITMNQLYSANVSWDVLERLKSQGRLGLFNLGYWGHPESTNAQDVAAWRERTIPRLTENWQEAKRRNLADNAILYGCDEVHAKDFAMVGLAARELKTAIPEVPLVTTARDWKRYGVDSPLDAVDWFVPGIQSEYYNPARAEASRAQGRRVGWYGDPDAPYANLLIETAAIDFRLLMGAMAVRMKPDGYLYYATANWGANKCIAEGPFTKWNPRSYSTLNGNGSWVCCGPDGMPLATIRLENFRDGLEDLWYAKILDGKIRERAMGNGERDDWLDRAKAALGVPRDVMDTMMNFTSDPIVLYRWRDAMADLIEEVSNSRQ